MNLQNLRAIKETILRNNDVIAALSNRGISPPEIDDVFNMAEKWLNQPFLTISHIISISLRIIILLLLSAILIILLCPKS